MPPRSYPQRSSSAVTALTGQVESRVDPGRYRSGCARNGARPADRAPDRRPVPPDRHATSPNSGWMRTPNGEAFTLGPHRPALERQPGRSVRRKGRAGTEARRQSAARYRRVQSSSGLAPAVFARRRRRLSYDRRADIADQHQACDPAFRGQFRKSGQACSHVLGQTRSRRGSACHAAARPRRSSAA